MPRFQIKAKGDKEFKTHFEDKGYSIPVVGSFYHIKPNGPKTTSPVSKIIQMDEVSITFTTKWHTFRILF